MATDVAGAAGNEYGCHWIIFVHGNIKKGEGQKRLPTEYTEKHGKRAKIKGKKSKGEFMPAAQNQGKKQGRIYDYIQKPNRTTLNIGINFSVFSKYFLPESH